jgi:hypothetical protein
VGILSEPGVLETLKTIMKNMIRQAKGPTEMIPLCVVYKVRSGDD